MEQIPGIPKKITELDQILSKLPSLEERLDYFFNEIEPNLRNSNGSPNRKVAETFYQTQELLTRAPFTWIPEYLYNNHFLECRDSCHKYIEYMANHFAKLEGPGAAYEVNNQLDNNGKEFLKTIQYWSNRVSSEMKKSISAITVNLGLYSIDEYKWQIICAQYILPLLEKRVQEIKLLGLLKGELNQRVNFLLLLQAEYTVIIPKDLALLLTALVRSGRAKEDGLVSAIVNYPAWSAIKQQSVQKYFNKPENPKINEAPYKLHPKNKAIDEYNYKVNIFIEETNKLWEKAKTF